LKGGKNKQIFFSVQNYQKILLSSGGFFYDISLTSMLVLDIQVVEIMESIKGNENQTKTNIMKKI